MEIQRKQQTAMSSVVIWIRFQSAPKALNCFVVLAEIFQGAAEIGPSLRMAGFKFDGFLKASNRLVELASETQGAAEIAVMVGRAWLQPQRFSIGLNRAIQFAAGFEDQPQV